MKKYIWILMVLLLYGCGSADHAVKDNMEKQAKLRIQVESKAYADALRKVWRKTYPNQADAVEFYVEPYYFSQDITKDIIWTNDIDATYLYDQLQEIDVTYTYEAIERLQREELEKRFTPVLGEGLVFCYREDRLTQEHHTKEDLISFERMTQEKISYYHNHAGEYIYPFFADQLPQVTTPFKELFHEDAMIARLQAYKRLNIAMNMPDDVVHQRDFYEEGNELCGLLSTKTQYETRKSYQDGTLHFTAMPTWQEEPLYPPFVTFGFAVSKECRYPKTAQRFLELVRSKEGMQALLDCKVKVPLIRSDDIEDFAIYDYAKKELLMAVNETQLYNIALLKENPGITMEAIFQQSELPMLIQNYVCSKQTATNAYQKLMTSLQLWTIGR